MRSAKEKYEGRKKDYKSKLEIQNKTVNVISNLRLFVVVAALAGFIYFYLSKSYYAAWSVAGANLLIFIYLVVIHNKAIKLQSYFSALYKVNDISLKRFDDGWKKFDDTGEIFKDNNHPYSQDLDIFGKASMFQWINTANTHMGRKMLCKAFTSPDLAIETIKMRQQAVNELSRKLWWRQRFQVEGMMVCDKLHDEEDLFKWADKRDGLYSKPWVIIGARIIPVITIISLVLSFGLNTIPDYVSYILCIVQFGMIYLGARERGITLDIVSKYKNNIKLYSKILKHIEKTNFKSPYLENLKMDLLDSKNQTAIKQIRELEKIVDRFSNRSNAMFLPINVLLLWEYQCMIALERWKEGSGGLVRRWVEAIGEIEALSSLSVIRHDYPEWAVPEFTDRPSILRSKSVGHPLLGGKQVCNDIKIESPTKALLITGSNMSGKSTLLRTAGINLIMAYAGAPVCGSSMECSVMRVHTCMRISDNLEKNISSFYAEILRIKDIVISLGSEEQVFFLLDEIFKGTNSQDRHIGAESVIKKLCESGAIGMVSTHDLELGELENETEGKVKNYHFQEYYENDKIYFDYKLRHGVSETKNALYLIKMAGIDA